MNEKLQEWIRTLEAEWSKPDGFLAKAREGLFEQREGADFVTTLKSIKPSQESCLDRRLVALLWYIPTFLRWQKERVAEKGGNAAAFEQLANQGTGLWKRFWASLDEEATGGWPILISPYTMRAGG